MTTKKLPGLRPSVEVLEARELLAAPVITESFDQTGAGSLPAGWSQWSNTGATSFAVLRGRSTSGSSGLATAGASDVLARTWNRTPVAADLQASANVFVDSLVPLQVLGRGVNLDSNTPSYYALTLSRGLGVQLQRVVRGTATTLGRVHSDEYLSGKWVRASLAIHGTKLQAQVHRLDTGQYLNSQGEWQASATYALERTDTAITGSGYAGLARWDRYFGTVTADDFKVTAAAAPAPPPSTNAESFEATAAGALPGGWAQWSNTGIRTFAVSTARSLSGTRSLVSSSASDITGRAWQTTARPADIQVQAALYADSLAPVQVFARGSRLDTSSPTYYSVAVTRGLQVRLQRVSNGARTVLATVRSSDYVSGKWVRITLETLGNRIRASVYRTDTGKYLTSGGQWQASPAWALDRTDGAITGGGQVGVARTAGVHGAAYLDDFATAPLSVERVGYADSFDNGTIGAPPAGWTQWSNSGRALFAVSNNRAADGRASLLNSSTSGEASRAWVTSDFAADLQASVAVYLESLAPFYLFGRGSNLAGASPSYYAVSITRGLQMQLLRVSNGHTTVLGTIYSADYVSNGWVRISLQANGSTIRAQVYRADSGQYLNSSGRWQSAPTWTLERIDSVVRGGGKVGLGRVGGVQGAVYADEFEVSTATAPPIGGGGGDMGKPHIPQHYSHIRIAALAYSGTPMGAFETRLLRQSIDLVIPNSSYLDHISSVAPNTPQLIYSNTTNIYVELLTDWLEYADDNGDSREDAFYHVTRATNFSGNSASSYPVARFWAVYRGGSLPELTDLTYAARATNNHEAFPDAGESLYLGFIEKFREINLSLVAAAGSGWQTVLEYPTAVDARGSPTTWSRIATLTNTTGGYTRSGQITFDPPSNWVTASLGGSPKHYYVRFRTIRGGQAPEFRTITGRDYVDARGRTSGVIPAFDYAADANRDGYLNNVEYARRASGKNARFVYESRLFYPNYGQMRYATNVSNAEFVAWAADYHFRYLNSQPQAGGLFMDNAVGKAPADTGEVRESVTNYARDYGALLKALSTKIAPRWVLANTVGGMAETDAVIRQNPAYIEEFSIRPMAHNWANFEDLSAMIRRRQSLTSPAPYAVLDSFSKGSSPTDPRLQLGTLAYYYLLGDPQRTFLMFFGGQEPASSWTRHWSAAAAFDVGQPVGRWSIFASGVDPSNRSLSYRVYQRAYTRSLVLYKPLSYRVNGPNGALGSETTTTHNLNGAYRPLRADGTLGAPVSRITLRNGEGAILVKA